MSVYASEEMPDIPVNDDGSPKPLPYTAPAKIEMTNRPERTRYNSCNGVYYQKEKKPFAPWYREKEGYG